MLKSEVRSLNRSLRDNMSPDEIADGSARIAKLLWDSEIYCSAENIMCYLNFRSEPITDDIISRAISDGKCVAAPVVLGNDMEFYRIHENEGFKIGAYGIREPLIQTETNRFIPHNHHKTLMLLPGLAFDTFGNRVGYGAGFYDRYIERYESAELSTCGICFDFMLADKIDADEFDRKVEYIITSKRIISCISNDASEEQKEI